MLGCIPPAEAPQGEVFPSPGDTEVSGGTGTCPEQLRSSGSCFLLAIQSSALGRIYGEGYQPRLQLWLRRFVFGLSLFFHHFVSGAVGLVEFAGMCIYGDAVEVLGQQGVNKQVPCVVLTHCLLGVVFRIS